MKHDSSNKDNSSLRQWTRLRLDVALKTEVIASCRRRSDVEWCEWCEWCEWRRRVEQVKP